MNCLVLAALDMSPTLTPNSLEDFSLIPSIFPCCLLYFRVRKAQLASAKSNFNQICHCTKPLSAEPRSTAMCSNHHSAGRGKIFTSPGIISCVSLLIRASESTDFLGSVSGKFLSSESAFSLSESEAAFSVCC